MAALRRISILLLVAVSAIFSQPPIPTPYISRQAKQRDTAKENKKSNSDNDDSHLGVPSNQSQSNRARGTTEAESQKTSDPPIVVNLPSKLSLTDWIIAFATVALVFVGIAQAFFMRSALAISRKSAEAAFIAAEAARDGVQISNRAILSVSARIRTVQSLRHTIPLIQDVMNSAVEIVIQNSGHTSSIKCHGQFTISLGVLNTSQILDIPASAIQPHSHFTLRSPPVTEMFGGKPFIDDLNLLEQVRQLKTAGWIKYSDVFGNEWDAPLLDASLDPLTGEFVNAEEVNGTNQ